MGVDYDLTIAGVHFTIHAPDNTRITKSFQPFLGEAADPDWNVTFSQAEEEPPREGKEVYSGYPFSVLKSEHGFTRCFSNHSLVKSYYAVSSSDWERGTVEVIYHPRELKAFSTIEKCFSHIGFEELLAARGRMILHASLVDTAYGGILFSGPSGIGKSTQAELWHTWEGGTVINGDRPILNCCDGEWMAYGSPYAGSSQYFRNASVPVTAIVLLEQGDTCEVQPVKPAEAFRRLYAQMVVNTWNPEFVTRICDMTLALAQHVPVYRLRCTPDARAVETLKAELQRRARV